MVSTARMAALSLAALTLIGGFAAERPDRVGFDTADGGHVFGDLYGDGSHAVVLAHGRAFDKESWSHQARRLQGAGLTVLAIDFRGYGDSRAGESAGALDLDVLAAVRFLKTSAGAERVSVVGASMGGWAAAQAATQVEPGEIDRLVLLAPGPIDDPGAIRAGSILYLVSEGEALEPRVRQQFDLAPEPKRLEVLEGEAHAQHVFRTREGIGLLDTIVDFLVTADDPTRRKNPS